MKAFISRTLLESPSLLTTRARHVARLKTSGLPQTSLQRGDHTRSALEAQTDLDGAEQHRLIKRVLSAWKTDSSRAIRASTGADQAVAEGTDLRRRHAHRLGDGSRPVWAAAEGGERPDVGDLRRRDASDAGGEGEKGRGEVGVLISPGRELRKN